MARARNHRLDLYTATRRQHYVRALCSIADAHVGRPVEAFSPTAASSISHFHHQTVGLCNLSQASADAPNAMQMHMVRDRRNQYS